MTATPTTRRPTGVRNAVSAAAPARRAVTAMDAHRSGRVFTVVALIVLIVFAVLWLVPSLFALRRR